MFADGGYSDRILLTPTLYNSDPKAKLELCNLRSVVETALGIVGNFRISGGKFRGNYVQQVLAVTLCYELTQWKMMRSLLRPDHVPKALQLVFYEASDKVLNASIEEMAALWNEAWIKAGYESSGIFCLNGSENDLIPPVSSSKQSCNLDKLQLGRLTVLQLKEMCNELGVTKQGNKKDLIA